MISEYQLIKIGIIHMLIIVNIIIFIIIIWLNLDVELKIIKIN